MISSRCLAWKQDAQGEPGKGSGTNTITPSKMSENAPYDNQKRFQIPQSKYKTPRLPQIKNIYFIPKTINLGYGLKPPEEGLEPQNESLLHAFGNAYAIVSSLSTFEGCTVQLAFLGNRRPLAFTLRTSRGTAFLCERVHALVDFHLASAWTVADALCSAHSTIFVSSVICIRIERTLKIRHSTCTVHPLTHATME